MPLKEAAPIRVRTGYERMIAHICGKPFATVAKEDGVIADVNEELQIVRVVYKSGKEEFISYAKEFSNNSGHGFYVPQNLQLNNFKKGDKVHKGDVIVYNKDFFIANPEDKQVDMKLGIPTTVAFIESDGNLDDASVVSKEFADKLKMGAGHVITLLLTKDTQIYECVEVGQKVLANEPLMTFDQNPLSDEEVDKYENDGLIDVLNVVSRTKPKAKYTGVISDIHVYYKCPISEMSNSMGKYVRKWTKTRNSKHKYTNDSFHFPESKPLRNDKVGSTLLTEETIVVKVTIEQYHGVGDGDKLFVGSANKSIVSDVIPEPILTESGRKVDLIHSAKGILARIVNSPIFVGTTSEVMKKTQSNMVDIFFN